MDLWPNTEQMFDELRSIHYARLYSSCAAANYASTARSKVRGLLRNGCTPSESNPVAISPGPERQHVISSDAKASSVYAAAVNAGASQAISP
jgi:hypothetical protein